MIPQSIEQLLSTESESTVEAMLADRDHVFLVDWREEDDAIVKYCEDILQTGDLAAELVEIDADPGFEIYISHRGKRVKVPLVVGPEDRHITLYTLNELLKPAFEIRVCVDSNGSDTLAFLPLSAAEWSGLEARYAPTVAKHFRRIEQRELLLATRGTTLVEASPHDRVWGIGLAADDPRARDRAQWLGLNLLGEALTRVREVLLWERSRAAALPSA
ncbi:MAG TPA: NADAR domain-containing protein [Candidatus Baltobacteraceae bacterium]|nr:NADAR domain-containing protein [Candidatus Baltobacteraceae bacterium]